MSIQAVRVERLLVHTRKSQRGCCGSSNRHTIESGLSVGRDERVVGVAALTGIPFRYASTHHNYVDPGTPKVDQTTAVAAARTAAQVGQESTVDETSLRVVFDLAGTQRLVWRVTLSSTTQTDGLAVPVHWFVEVDADTGSAEILGQG